MLSNLKTRFERNLIYVSCGVALLWARSGRQLTPCLLGSVGSMDVSCWAPD